MSTTEHVQAAADLATFTVNGEELKAPKGANLLRALVGAGYEIPHYCYHPSLSVAGSCRLCFVQMEGDPRLHASCNMKVADGLKILTETPAIKEARAGMMEFLLVNHPLDCPVCDKGGECMLQRYSMDHGITDARTTDERRRYAKPQFDPLIDLERNRCILCSRCVRFCDEIGENHVLGIVERGDRNRISSFGDGPISSIFSGNVIDLCPVGALTSKPFRFHARTWELQQIVTTCTYCSVGCEMTAWARDGKVLRVTTPVVRKGSEFALNEDTSAFICNQGRFGSDFGQNESRITSAQVWRNGALVNAPTEEALGSAVDELKRVKEKYGAESIACIAGPRATNEELHLFQRIAREGIGTANIDWRVHLSDATICAAHSAAMAMADATIQDIESSDCVLVIESALLNSVPVLALKLKEAAKHGKNKTILLGSVTDEFIAKYASGNIVRQPADVLALIAKIGDASKGNGDADLNALQETVAKANSGLIVFSLSEQSGELLPALVSAIQGLRERLGANWKVLPVAAERNAVGANALGCQPDTAEGGCATAPGLSAPEILQAAAEGRVKALYVLGQDLLRLAPDQELLAKALDAVEVLIVQDAFPGPASAKASVVLPGALFTEKDGTLTSVDGSLSRLVKGCDAPKGVMGDCEMLLSVARGLGLDLTMKNAEDVFADYLGKMSPETKCTYFDLTADQPGEEWPLRVKSYTRKKTRPQINMRNRTAQPGKPAPFGGAAVESKGQLFSRWSWDVTRADQLGDYSPTLSSLRVAEPTIRLNQATATELGLVDSQRVRINCEGGGSGIEAILKTTDCVAPGVLHFAVNDIPADLARRALTVGPASE